MSEFDWGKLLSKNDPIGVDSPFYVSDLPFTQKMVEAYASLKNEDKESIRNLLKNEIVIDLGSGNPKQSTFIRQLSCESEAKEYVGIDMNFPRAELFDEYPGSRIVRMKEECEGKSLPVTLLREEMIVALRNLEGLGNDSGFVFVLVGIETAEEKTFYPLAKALASLCSSSDRVLLGVGSHGIPLEDFGFKLEKRILRSGRPFCEVYSLW